MKTALKLVLVYVAFQVVAAFIGTGYGIVYSLVKYGVLDIKFVHTVATTPAMLLGFIFMAGYLWKTGYISTEKQNWSPISASYMAMTVAIFATAVLLLDFLMSYMEWLPDLMESTFNDLQSSWLGILCIAVLGPILEELLFRGAITKALLKQYNPAKAIIISALVFGIIHVNPAQVVSAASIGLLLAWIYYKTASLIPCILIHILNNSLSVFLSLKYPEVETTKDLFTNNSTYYIFILAAFVIFAGLLVLMKRTTVPYPWKAVQTDTIV